MEHQQAIFSLTFVLQKMSKTSQYVFVFCYELKAQVVQDGWLGKFSWLSQYLELINII